MGKVARRRSGEGAPIPVSRSCERRLGGEDGWRAREGQVGIGRPGSHCRERQFLKRRAYEPNAEVQRFGLGGLRKPGLQPAELTVAVSAGGLEVWLGGACGSQPMIQHDVEKRQASAAAQDYSGEHRGLQGPQPSPGHGGNISRRPRGGGEPWPSEPPERQAAAIEVSAGVRGRSPSTNDSSSSSSSSSPARAQVLIVARSSPHPDPQREIGLMAWVNGTSSGCTRSGLST